MPRILLFNIREEEKRTAIRLTALRHGITLQEIPPEYQSLMIEELLAGREAAVPCEDPFEEELLLMHELPSGTLQAFLDTLRTNGKTVRLKAVVTETNRKWTAKDLHRELLKEEEAIRRWKQSAHQRKK